MQPIDLTTGLPCGSDVKGDIEVMVGYLATHVDGSVARLGPDRTRAELYAVTHHATIEQMYVKRGPHHSIIRPWKQSSL